MSVQVRPASEFCPAMAYIKTLVWAISFSSTPVGRVIGGEVAVVNDRGSGGLGEGGAFVAE